MPSARAAVCCTAILAVFFSAAAGGQTIWYVDAANCPGPGDGSQSNPFCKIQDAIDAAAPSATPPDEIRVADGTYTGSGNKNLDFGGKIIALRSASGNPATCIIDCESSGRGFYFHCGETAEAVVDGFTIEDSNDVGINCSNSSPTFAYCIITGNGRGGVRCSSSSLTLIECTIKENGSMGGLGGGVYCYSSSLTLTGCTISANGGSTTLGGGIYCISACPTLSHCTISENRASCGGGLYCYSSSPSLTNCTISGNTVSGGYVGGGVYCASSSNPLLANCTISGNTVTGSDSGGGLYCKFSSPSLTNCTITGNMVSVIPGSGAIVCSGGSAPTLTNCILWGDAPQEIFSSGNPVLSYCDVQGGWPGTGNINTDPCFAFTDDLHLTPRSPCIDAGTNIPLGGLPGPDADGNARVLDGNGDGQAVADMGAYEFDSADPTIALSPSVLEVYAWAGGPNPDPQLLSIRNPAGSTLNWQISETCSWVGAAPSAGSCQHEINPVTLSFDTAGLATGDYSCMLTIYAPPAINSPRTLRVTLHLGAARRVPTEYATIQAAISAAVQNDWVLVADGVWTGTGNTNLDFAGKNLVLRSLNGAANCVIDCQESGCGFYFHTGETSTTRVEGITIRGARTGGVYCYNSSPTIVDCIISGNAHGGGGVYCGRSRLTATNCVISGNVGSSGGGLTADSSSPTLTNCTITGNTAWYGGGVSCSSYSNATLTGCLISGNRAYNGGGVFCSSNSKPTLTNCAISENTASSSASSAAYGGGLYSNASKPMLTNCTIRGNIARHGGGAYCESSSPTLTNCTISGNSTSDDGGGVYCYDQSSPTLTNCILWGNPPEEIHIFNSSPTLTYCDIQGSWPGTGNINADPLFVDAANGNFHLAANSPCIDAGSNAAIPAGITTDIDGDPRILPGHPLHVTLPHPGQPGPPASASVVDMGAYEFRLAPPPEPKEVLIGSPIAKPSGRTDGATSPTSPAGIRR